MELSTTFEYESDHRAIVIDLEIGAVEQSAARTYFDFRRTDVRRFRRRLDMALEGHSLPVEANVTTTDIDRCVHDQGTAFREVIDTTVPKRPVRDGTLCALPNRVLRFIRERRRLCRILRDSGDTQRHYVLRADIRNLDQIIKESILICEHERRVDFLNSIRVDNSMYMRVRGRLVSPEKVQLGPW